LHESLSQILAPYKGKKGSAITALQTVQEKLGYLPEEGISEIANILGMSQNELYGVATFYSQFRFTKRGEHNIQVCSGTACHVRGSPKVVEALEEELSCTCGETTKDGKFSLEKIACFGACALAPVMVVDKKVYGRMTTPQVKKVLANYP
jgi:NADH-quinone oxidoreductase subunit E